MSEMMESSTRSVTYVKKPNTIVQITQFLLDILKGTTSGVYHLAEDFVLGTIQMLGDIPGTLEALGSMIAQPIDTVKYIGNVVINSFNRDVIHGDAESRSHWFTYAAGSIFGFKGLGNVGKAGATAARKGAQRAGQKLDELLPYHPKHQLAFDGPVPYNVYDGNFFKEQLMVRVESSYRQEKDLKSGDKISSKGTGREYKNYSPVEYKGTTKINGEVRDTSRRVFQRKDIDYERVDPKTGKTNYRLMKSGRSPIWKDGTKIELHHLIQREPGTIVELPSSMHKAYDRILHGLVENGGSFRNDPVLKKQYENFRSKYWRWRAKQIDKDGL